MIKAKLLNIGKDIHTVISELVQESNVINLTQISPDFPCPAELTKLAEKYIKKGFNQYSHIDGLLELREAIAEKMAALYGVNYSPVNEVTITAGATQAIYTAISTFVNEGDEVVLFEPAYSSYIPAIVNSGGRPVFVQLKRPDYYIDWDEVQKIINTRTKLIIVNTPHNPTGSIFSEEDIAQLKKITNGTKIMVICNESFEHLVFDNKKHHSISGNPQLAERSIIISSFGKTFNIPGWKIGYCMAPEKMMNQIRKSQMFQINSVNTPLQYALADFLKTKIDYSIISKTYEENRNLVLELLMDSRFEIVPSKGTFYQLLDYKALSNDKDTDFARKLIDQIGVALFPLSVFYHDSIDNKILGLCFNRNKEMLKEACERLKKISPER
jgi:methionine transaminase